MFKRTSKFLTIYRFTSLIFLLELKTVIHKLRIILEILDTNRILNDFNSYTVSIYSSLKFN